MINILLCILIFFLFFSYALVSLQLIFPIIAVGIVITFFFKRFNKRINILKEDPIWIVCILINLVGLIRTPNINEAVVFAGFILVFILLKISLSSLENWKEVFTNVSLIFSSIHVFSTLIQYLSPEIIQRINHAILPSSAYNINRYQSMVGKYAGITGQVGANAFYITIFITITFCGLVQYKKKYIRSLFLFLGFVALFLTTKRGLLMFNVIAVIAIILIVKFSKLKNDNKIILFLLATLMVGLLSIVGLSLVANIPLLNQLLLDQDITSGRMEIYSSTFELVKLAPLIGNGLSSVEYHVGIKAHNIYLQLWAELGVFGLIVYLSAMMVTLINSIKLYTNKQIEGYIELKYFILISIYIQIIFILYGLTGNVLYDYFMVGVYMIAISLPGSVRLSLKRAGISITEFK